MSRAFGGVIFRLRVHEFGIAIAFHVSPMRVLSVAFDVNAGVRPGWQVLAAGLAVVAIDFACARWRGRAAGPRAVAAE